MISKNARPRPRVDIIAEPLDADILLYDPKTRTCHLLNSTAAHIWACLDGEQSVQAIAEQLVATYALSLEEALTDLTHILENLHWAGLLSED
jgi:Coenzyme PQQ synthesis protein D (PqqD)